MRKKVPTILQLTQLAERETAIRLLVRLGLQGFRRGLLRVVIIAIKYLSLVAQHSLIEKWRKNNFPGIPNPMLTKIVDVSVALYTIFSLGTMSTICVIVAVLSASGAFIRETISRLLLFWFSLLDQRIHTRMVITVNGTATAQYIQILGDADREDASSPLVPPHVNMFMLNNVATNVAGR